MGNSVAVSLKYDFKAVEVYNRVCHSLNGKGDSTYVWDAMLDSRPGTLALSVDDAHFTAKYPTWAGGWIMVNAEQRMHAAIWRGIREGNYYSTNGPEFQSIVIDHQEACVRTVHVHTSPMHFIRLVGPRYERISIGEYGGFINQAPLKLPPEWSYARLELKGPGGLRAWTNSLFL